MIQQMLRVILNDQAYLYAMILKGQAQSRGTVVTEEQFARWQDEWKEQTDEILKTLVEEGEESVETDNPS